MKVKSLKYKEIFSQRQINKRKTNCSRIVISKMTKKRINAQNKYENIKNTSKIEREKKRK